ncbi:WD-repeat protein-like protein [Dinothrombium tinctorium]|uniref:WD-repeat protein-like protein n=1 Tax=Dinothrombium tinctorium TaxID=1965070 RepID=A0A3S3PG03_9ACAR|nr:WD-repeat protein-like protein [Dinothrombium tinctorium]
MASVKKIAINRKRAPVSKDFNSLNLKDRLIFKEKFTRLKELSNIVLGNVESCESSSTSSRQDSAAGGSEQVIRKLEEKQALLTKLLHDLQYLEYKYLNGGQSVKQKSSCVVDYIHSRMMGNDKLQNASITKEFGINHLLVNCLLKETNFKLNGINKVFCSQWLSDRQIVFGTKCNKVMLLDVKTGKIFRIPSLKSSALSKPPENSCGIHSIEINPSRTLLATGGDNPNDIAIYKLPTLDPLCVGEGAHSDWTFDLAWLDDQFLVSGSRDSTLALWRVDPENEKLVTQRSFPNYYTMNPLLIKHCKEAEKIRAVIFNENALDVVALSLNAQIHVLDAQTLKIKNNKRLPFLEENVCLSYDLKHNLYAIGSKSNVSLLDSRTLEPTTTILSKYRNQGVRSVSFTGNILTIGTGCGIVLFYDVNANKYIEKSDTMYKQENFVKLKATKGWEKRDEILAEYINFSDWEPAVYTHQYDKTGTRIFAAGGPLPANMQGSYAGLWD